MGGRHDRVMQLGGSRREALGVGGGAHALEVPVAGEVGFEQAHCLHDGGMHRPGLSGQVAAGLRDRLAELAKQERKATDDTRP
jgi:hypothetical protein